MSDEKKKKIGEVLEIVKQNGGTRMIDEFGDAVEKQDIILFKILKNK